MLLKLPSRVLLLVLSIQLNIAGFGQNSIKDSIDILISNETDPEAKLTYIVNGIELMGLSSKTDVLSYFKKGESLIDDVSPLKIRSLYETTGQQLSLIKEVAASTKMFKALDSVGKVKNIPVFEGFSLMSLSDHDKRTGKLSASKDKLNEAIQIFRKYGDKEGVGIAWSQLGSIHRLEGQMELAVSVLDSSESILKEINNVANLIVTHSNKGRVFRSLGEHSKAKEQYMLALDLVNKSNDIKMKATILNNIGNIEQIAGNMEKAIEYYLESIEIKQQLSNFSGLAIGYHNVGSIELKLGDYESAKKYFEQSLEVARQIDNKVLIIHNLNKLGSTSFEEKFHEDARAYHFEAANLSQSIGFKKGEVSAWYYLGKDNLAAKNYRAAIEALKKSLQLAKEIGSKPYESAIYVVFSQVYIANKNDIEKGVSNLGMSSRQIEELLLRSRALANEMQNSENQLEALKGLSSFYEDKNNYKASASVLKDFMELKDTLYSEKSFEITRDLETKYETLKKEKEIIRLESEKALTEVNNRRKTNLLYSLIGLVLLGGIIGYQFVGYRNKINQEREKLNFRNEISTELHDDVGSILTGIAMQSELLTRKVAPEQKESMGRISNLSRNAMYRMRDIVWALDSNKNSVGDLKVKCCEFAQQILEPNEVAFTFQNDIEGATEIHPKVRQNLYMVTKEAMANVIKHSDAKRVSVSLKKERGFFCYTIKDDGTPKESASTTGSGLNNIIQRVKSIGGEIETNVADGFNHYIQLKAIDVIG